MGKTFEEKLTILKKDITELEDIEDKFFKAGGFETELGGQFLMRWRGARINTREDFILIYYFFKGLQADYKVAFHELSSIRHEKPQKNIALPARFNMSRHAEDTTKQVDREIKRLIPLLQSWLKKAHDILELANEMKKM